MSRIYCVENLLCVNCKKILSKALADLDGIRKISVSLPRKEIEVDADFGRISDSDIIDTIASRMYMATRKDSAAGKQTGC